MVIADYQTSLRALFAMRAPASRTGRAKQSQTRLAIFVDSQGDCFVSRTQRGFLAMTLLAVTPSSCHLVVVS